ncbi:MAG TPA: thioredoxin TrxC [Casimicrobiaceae bacterium]
MDVKTVPATVNVVCPHCDTVNRVPRERLAEGARCGSCKAPLFDAHPIELAEAAFERHVANSDLPLVVDFWAPWCAPCRMMAPIFERAARALAPHARLAKVNTDQAQELALGLGIRGIPTLAIFKGGKEVARTSGAMDESRFVAWVRSYLQVP